MRVNKYKLKNGLTIVFLNFPNFNSVYLSLFIKAGLIHETKEDNGLAHLVEHVFYRKILNRLRDSSWVRNYLYYDFDAETNIDYTKYKFYANKKDLDLVLDLLSMVIKEDKVKKDEVDLEKDIILEEISEDLSDSEFAFGKFIRDKFYKNHILKNRILGTKKSVSILSDKNVINFIKNFYRPNNSILTLAGNFDEKDVMKKVKKLFYVSAVNSKLVKFPPFSSVARGAYFLDNKKKQISFSYYYVINNSSSKENIRLEFVIGFFRQYLVHMVRDKGFCYSLDLDSNGYDDFMELWINSYFSSDKVVAFVQELKEAFENFVNNISEQILEEYRMSIIKNIEIDTDFPKINADIVSHYLLTFDKVISLVEKKKIIREMNINDVKSIFNKIFNFNGSIFFSGSISSKQKDKIRHIWYSK